MRILILVALFQLVRLRVRCLFAGLDDLLHGRNFFTVEVLVFSVSSGDTEGLGNQVVLGFLSAVRKP